MAADAPDVDPLTVDCPDCLAKTGHACYIGEMYDGGSHASRHQVAVYAALERGTCALCGQVLVRGSLPTDDRVEVYHPVQEDRAKCPPLPDPSTHWNDYAEALAAGAKPGYPGAEHFQPIVTIPDPAAEPS